MLMALSRLRRFHVLRTLQIGWPIMLGQLGHMLTGLADSAMIGQVDAIQLAAASFGHNGWVIFFVFGLGVSMGLTPHVAAADGKNDPTENAHLMRQGFWVNLITGIAIALLMLAGYPLLDNLGQPDEVVVYARPYFLILALSMLPLMLFQHFRQFAEGLSLTRTAMYVSIGANLLNVLLNYVLIFGKFGLPRLELVGAGIATFISRVVMVLLMYWYVRKAVPFQQFWLPAISWKPVWSKMKHILQVGVPIGMQYVLEAGAFVTAAIMIGWLGALPLASHQIAIVLASTTFMAASGIAAAVTVRVGKYLGAEDIQNLRRAAFTGFGIVALFMGVTGISFLLLRHTLPALFTPEPLVQGITASLLIVAGAFQVFDGMQLMGMATLRGMKDVRFPTGIALFSYWIIGLPVGYLLGFTFQMGVTGVWWGLATGLAVASVLLFARFQRHTNRMLTAAA